MKATILREGVVQLVFDSVEDEDLQAICTAMKCSIKSFVELVVDEGIDKYLAIHKDYQEPNITSEDDESVLDLLASDWDENKEVNNAKS